MPKQLLKENQTRMISMFFLIQSHLHLKTKGEIKHRQTAIKLSSEKNLCLKIVLSRKHKTLHFCESDHCDSGLSVRRANGQCSPPGCTIWSTIRVFWLDQSCLLLRILVNNDVLCLSNLKTSDILFFFYFHKCSNYFDELPFRKNANNTLLAQSSNPNITQPKKGQN